MAERTRERKTISLIKDQNSYPYMPFHAQQIPNKPNDPVWNSQKNIIYYNGSSYTPAEYVRLRKQAIHNNNSDPADEPVLNPDNNTVYYNGSSYTLSEYIHLVRNGIIVHHTYYGKIQQKKYNKYYNKLSSGTRFLRAIIYVIIAIIIFLLLYL